MHRLVAHAVTEERLSIDRANSCKIRGARLWTQCCRHLGQPPQEVERWRNEDLGISQLVLGWSSGRTHLQMSQEGCK